MYLPYLITFGSTALGYFLGVNLCKWLNLKNLSWKLGLVLACVAFSACILVYKQPKYGIDLRGGVILNYEVDEQKTGEIAAEDELPDGSRPSTDGAQVDMNALVQSLIRRINPSGVREMVIRPYGLNQVEIIIPEVSESEINVIKEVIKNTGFLEFRIVADKDRNARAWEAGKLALESEDPKVKRARFVSDNGEVVGEWVLLGKEKTSPSEPARYRVPYDDMLTRELVPGNLEVLMTVDSELKLEGKHLRTIRTGNDEQGRPNVEFDTTPDGAVLFGSLTGMNLPDKAANSYAKLGIVMDGVLLSAPRIESRISSNGQISGRFTPEEVDALVRVLRAGKLPAVLRPEPISENNISPLLGEDTIAKGKVAIMISLLAVPAFMVFYYRFAGIVACIALALNLLFVLATMLLIDAAFTLPGLAGIVLTVGMAVDANVLIYERMREELTRGATLKMAIRNGFERAMSTIVDSNVTTLITAIILYAIGTDNIKGFGVTLILGILTSMFTAIFCSRIVFDIAERKGWVKKLTMSRIIGDTSIDFLSKGSIAIALSLLVIGVGLAGAFARGVRLFDIDFTGGASVTCLLSEPLPIEQVRERVGNVADDVSVTQINPAGRTKDTVYKIDASIQDQELLKQRLEQAFEGENGKSLLVHRSMQATAPVSLVPANSQSRHLPTLPSSLGFGYASLTGVVTAPQVEASSQPDTAAGEESPQAPEANGSSDQPAAATPATPQEATSEAANSQNFMPPVTASSSAEDGGMLSSTTLTFEEKSNARTVVELINKAAKDAELEQPRVTMSAEGWDGVSDYGYKVWDVKWSTGVEDTAKIVAALTKTVENTPVWLSANRIGGKVAGDMQLKAITSIVLSCIAIIIYVWVRFQHLIFGLAAVIALVHDVLVTVGAVALSYWAAGFMMIDPFKISLPIVAAVLTVIGFSINDTIVIFDRIREVKGKSPELTYDMVNTSVNQTLSRTLLTSLTVLIVVLILYFVGGEGIHGFSYAMVIGVFAGTYSTVFIACPVLNWMILKKASPAAKKPLATTTR